MTLNPNLRAALVALFVVGLDQLSKLAVLRNMDYAEQRVLIEGFFKLVHWGNTGAAWSMFHDRNNLLALISLIALVVLILVRRHFEFGVVPGQVALGMIFGGIIGNLIDRVVHKHVIDFIYFYVHPRGGGEIGFPAFNIADSAICLGVVTLFYLSLRQPQRTASTAASSGPA